MVNSRAPTRAIRVRVGWQWVATKTLINGDVTNIQLVTFQFEFFQKVVPFENDN